LDKNTVLVFTRNGMGSAPEELQSRLASIFLSLLDQSGALPSKILFYTDGVKMAVEGSPVLDQLQSLETSGVELILCKTCLKYYGLSDRVSVGIVGGMPDIIDAMHAAEKVISL